MIRDAGGSRTNRVILDVCRERSSGSPVSMIGDAVRRRPRRPRASAIHERQRVIRLSLTWRFRPRPALRGGGVGVVERARSSRGEGVAVAGVNRDVGPGEVRRRESGVVVERDRAPAMVVIRALGSAWGARRASDDRARGDGAGALVGERVAGTGWWIGGPGPTGPGTGRKARPRVRGGSGGRWGASAGVASRSERENRSGRGPWILVPEGDGGRASS